jgi:hypothetical protein
MRRRTFEEMITYFNQTVSEMDIDQKYKMTLLGIVTALLQKHDEDVAQIVRCKDCKYWIAHDKRCVYLNHGFAPNMWCCHGERRTDA